MRKFQRQNVLFYIVIGLIAIGILSMIARNPAGAIIPVAVLGTVFLLYKYPPQQWRGMMHRAKSFGTSDGTGKNARKTKRAKFRVIPGTKRDDDDIPKYH
jgi:hypothetical protein